MEKQSVLIKTNKDIKPDLKYQLVRLPHEFGLGQSL